MDEKIYDVTFIKADGLGIVDSIGCDAFMLPTKRKRQIAFREFISLLKKLKLIPSEMHVGALARGMDANGEPGYLVTSWQEATKVAAQGPQGASPANIS